MANRLCLDLGYLREHKFKHSFQDSLNPLCSCRLDVESMSNFFVHCPLFSIQRQALLRTVINIDRTSLRNTDSIALSSSMQLSITFYHPQCNCRLRSIILNATFDYVLSSSVQLSITFYHPQCNCRLRSIN